MQTRFNVYIKIRKGEGTSFLKTPYTLNLIDNNTETHSTYSETIPLLVGLNSSVKLDDAKVC